MKPLSLVSLESATGTVAENLAAVRKKFGFIPHLYASFANNPFFLDGYMKLSAEFDKSANLTSIEKDMVLLAASAENHCEYCVAGYTVALLKKKANIEIIKALRMREPVLDGKVGPLVELTKEIVAERGNIGDKVRRDFMQAGYSELAIMDVLTGVAMKTMATYFFHIFPVEIDAEYQAGVGAISIEEAMR